MNKIVEVESCSECPKAMFVETRDPAVPRVYVGCGLSHRSFDYEFMNANPMPIQRWCELPDAPMKKRTVNIYADELEKPIGVIEVEGEER